MIYDTRSFFAPETQFGSKIYIRLSVEKSGRYKAEFNWEAFGTETRVRTEGFGTSICDAVSLAFHTQDLSHMESVLIYLCPGFPACYWDSIKRMTPKRVFNS